MATLRFGTREEIVCIADLTMKRHDARPQCLAYKTSIHYFGAGLYVSNDGYVLGLRGKSDEYVPLDASTIQAHQAAGELPSPLPAYSLPWSTYAHGYSLWLCILGAILFELGRRALASRRKAGLDRLRATEAPSLGPPALRTKGDSFVAAQVGGMLGPDERVEHQAYGNDRDPSEAGLDAMSAMGVFAVLTSQRLILIRTRIGAFGVLFENHGVEAFERNAIIDLAEEGPLLTFTLAGGAKRQIQVNLRTRALSNQLAFLRDVPRLLGGTRAPAPERHNPFASSAP